MNEIAGLNDPATWRAIDNNDSDVMFLRLRDAWVLDVLEKLVLVRKAAGVTREYLAAQLGVSEGYIKRIEMNDLSEGIPIHLLFKWMWQCGAIPEIVGLQERNSIRDLAVEDDQGPNL